MKEDIVSEALKLVRWANEPAMTISEIYAYLRNRRKDVKNLVLSASQRVVNTLEPGPGLGGRKADAQLLLDEFAESWRLLKQSGETTTLRLAGLEAIEAAFALGCLVGENGGADAVRKQLHANRMTPAWEAVRANSVQQIIDRAALELWEQPGRQNYRGNAHRTAGEITGKVVVEIRNLPKIPPRWRKCVTPGSETAARAAICRRLRTLCQANRPQKAERKKRQN